MGVAMACLEYHHWAMANVSSWSIEQFDAATHDPELGCSAAVHVVVDAAHMGLGGDDSWSPAVHQVGFGWQNDRFRALIRFTTTGVLGAASKLHSKHCVASCRAWAAAF